MTDVNMNYSAELTDVNKMSIEVPAEYEGEHPFTFKSDGLIYGFRVFNNNVAYVTVSDLSTVKIFSTHEIEKLSESDVRIHFPRK